MMEKSGGGIEREGLQKVRIRILKVGGGMTEPIDVDGKVELRDGRPVLKYKGPQTGAWYEAEFDSEKGWVAYPMD